MSTIKVEVTTIRDIRPHTNADKLELATINGWQVAIQKGRYHVDQPVIYFEQGTVISQEMADNLGVTNYLSGKTDIDGNRVLVVNRIKLRGEPSYGLVIPGDGYAVGQDVADVFGAYKYRPPVKLLGSDAEVDHALFHKYTEVENLRSYPDIFMTEDDVVVTEKIHGTNCRVGFVVENGEAVWMAGSRQLRRKDPGRDKWKDNLYWMPLSEQSVIDLMEYLLLNGAQSAVLYGEVFGRGVQSYDYGKYAPVFSAFDLMVNGRYLDYDEFKTAAYMFDVPIVPTVYTGKYDIGKIKELSDGESTVGGKHGREGVVVKPVKERIDTKIGRVILKYVGDQYLFGKAAEQDTTDL